MPANSLCDAALGVLHSGSLAVCTIGQGLADAGSLKPQACDQAGRPVAVHPAINVDGILARWVPFVIGARTPSWWPWTGPTSKPTDRLVRSSLGIECTLHDTKDLRFGMGLGTIHVNSAERRDRLWLINAFAVVLLTLLGAAGEALGYHRMLKTSTVKRRVLLVQSDK